jgi:hypothetical protein
MGRILELFYSSFSFLSVSCTIAGFVISLAKEPHAPLQVHLVKSIAAGVIPSAVVLIVGAFNPESLTKVKGLEVPITFGGIALLYVSLIEALK